MSGDWVLDEVKVDMEYRVQQVHGPGQINQGSRNARAALGGRSLAWDKVLAKITGKAKDRAGAASAHELGRAEVDCR